MSSDLSSIVSAIMAILRGQRGGGVRWPYRYMWSATDSGLLTPLFTQPVRFSVLSFSSVWK